MLYDKSSLRKSGFFTLRPNLHRLSLLFGRWQNIWLVARGAVGRAGRRSGLVRPRPVLQSCTLGAQTCAPRVPLAALCTSSRPPPPVSPLARRAVRLAGERPGGVAAQQLVGGGARDSSGNGLPAPSSPPRYLLRRMPAPSSPPHYLQRRMPAPSSPAIISYLLRRLPPHHLLRRMLSRHRSRPLLARPPQGSGTQRSRRGGARGPLPLASTAVSIARGPVLPPPRRLARSLALLVLLSCSLFLSPLSLSESLSRSLSLSLSFSLFLSVSISLSLTHTHTQSQSVNLKSTARRSVWLISIGVRRSWTERDDYAH